jgi:hypothetical protein
VAIGAHRQRRSLGHADALGRPAVDAGDHTLLDEHLVDREVGAHLDARRASRFEQQQVELRPSHAVAFATVRPGAFEHQSVALVEIHVSHRRRVRRAHAIEQPQAFEPLDTGNLDLVRRQRLARKSCLIDEEDALAGARQQHRQG